MKPVSTERAGASRGNMRTYTIGFVFSIMLTVIPFALVTSGAAFREIAIPGICVAGILQILVHLHYFLHLDASSTQRWNVLALIFTFLIMVLFVGGTLWVMYTLNLRMM